MLNLEQKVEAILFFKNEPMSIKELSKLVEETPTNIKTALENLQGSYANKGIVLVLDGEEASLGTHPDASALIEAMQKEELSRDLGRAGLETLAIILYKGPISRREIDFIRGVNSGFILRNLLIRGLIERAESEAGERSYSYKSTEKLLRYLGLTRKEDLPEFETALSKIAEFNKNQKEANGENE